MLLKQIVCGASKCFVVLSYTSVNFAVINQIHACNHSCCHMDRAIKLLADCLVFITEAAITSIIYAFGSHGFSFFMK
jgi:hypothetical protein